eukprot:scaffold298226_cov16-Prasinocladus_malaysianus.AAC.1
MATMEARCFLKLRTQASQEYMHFIASANKCLESGRTPDFAVIRTRNPEKSYGHGSLCAEELEQPSSCA